MKTCVQCGKIIKGRKSRAITCSDDCARNRIKDRDKRHNAHRSWGIPPGTVGAVHELIVSADLMKFGLHVFRAMSPCCPCDLAVLHNGKMFRIEVTTGHSIGTLSKVFYPSKNKLHFDVLAVVVGGIVKYEPDIHSFFGLKGERNETMV